MLNLNPTYPATTPIINHMMARQGGIVSRFKKKERKSGSKKY